MKTLYIISKGMDKLDEEEIIRLEKLNEIPRVTLLQDAVSAELLDERYLSNKPPYLRRLLYRMLPVSVSQLIETLFIYHRYDTILSHSERAGLPLALILKVLKIEIPHLVVISRITSVDEKKSNQKRWFLKKTKDSISRFLIWSSVQRKIAIEDLGVPADKIILLKRGIDQKFWKPQNTESDMICSVGMEARDYPTLVEALRPLDIPCHIAAGASRGEIFNTVKKLHQIQDLPDHITVGPLPSNELRKLYARSRFVVVPLLPTDSDNGLTSILESMAMGKTVICTGAEGQVDIIQDGVTGLYVPQGNPEAMSEAIQTLWNDPKRCETMGKAARAFIEEHHTMEQFVAAIRDEVYASVEEHESSSKFQFERVEL